MSALDDARPGRREDAQVELRVRPAFERPRLGLQTVERSPVSLQNYRKIIVASRLRVECHCREFGKKSM